MKAIVERFDHAFAGLLCCCKHGFGFDDVHRKRFFAQDMFARFQRLNRPFGMEIDRKRIVDQIDVG